MRDRILGAAADTLDTLPLSKLTMEDIARTAGIARQTIYKHFSNQNEIVIALFVDEIMTKHHPRLTELHRATRSRLRLAEMFCEQLELASNWSLLGRTFDPQIAPSVAELVLSSPELAAVNVNLWLPILSDYRDDGILRPDLDLSQAIRWMTYQSVWFLSHPRALTASAAETLHYVDTFIFGAMTQAPAGQLRGGDQ